MSNSILENLQIDETSLDREVLFVTQNKDLLKSITNLRKRYSKETTDFIIEQAELRVKALRKLPENIANVLLYEKSALEQASNWNVSKYRAERIKLEYKKIKNVWDLCCGIGIDTINIAEIFDNVSSVDLDEVRIDMLSFNCRKLGLDQKVKQINSQVENILSQIETNDVVYIDPARRDNVGKKFSILDYQPSIEIINLLLERTKNVIVKISPAVDLQELELFSFKSEYELEFISENSELKEAVLWFGLSEERVTRATILPENYTIVSTEVIETLNENCEVVNYTYVYGSEQEEDTSKFEISNLKYLYEPDFAIIRSGLLEQLAVKLKLSKIDIEIAYLGGDLVNDLNWFRNRVCYKVIEVFDNRLDLVIQYLKDVNINFIDVKKRGVEIDPDEIQVKVNKQIKAKDKINSAVLIFTRINNDKKIIVTTLQR